MAAAPRRTRATASPACLGPEGRWLPAWLSTRGIAPLLEYLEAAEWTKARAVWLLLAAGAVAAPASVLAGPLIPPGHAFTAAHGFRLLSLGDGPVLRASLGSAFYLALIALFSLPAQGTDPLRSADLLRDHRRHDLRICRHRRELPHSERGHRQLHAGAF
jgi:hypothetical protein